MKTILAIIAFAAPIAFGQQYYVYDSRATVPPTNAHTWAVVDFANRADQVTERYRKNVALWDVMPFVADAAAGVTVTFDGSITGTQARLNAAISNAAPARAKLSGKSWRAEAASIRTNAAQIGNSPVAREVERLATMIEAIAEELGK